MSTSPSILDSLVIAPVALAPVVLSEDLALVNTSISLHTPAGRKLQFASPFFVRGDVHNKADATWDVLCEILRKLGIPLFARLGEVDKVPAASVPTRIAVRTQGQPLVKSELQAADAFELSNCDAFGTNWGWPLEIEGNRDLKSFVQVLRQASGGEVPLGLSLPLGATIADIRACVESTVDFLTLRFSPACMSAGSSQTASLAALGVLNARKQCTQLGRADLPLLLDAPVTEATQAIKLLALGATAVNVCAMVDAALPSVVAIASESKLAESLLGSFSPVVKPVRELPQVERCLQQVVTSLRAALHYAGLMDIQQLDSNCLRSLSLSVAELTGIAPLGSR